MIFATVGTQLPFHRLLLDLNDWARQNPHIPVTAQCGSNAVEWSHINTVSHLSQSEFRAHIEEARLVVAHAGMGTIISAAELNKNMIIMPRRAALNEHRNDHQQDTAREMAHLSNVTVAEDGKALHAALDRAISRKAVGRAIDNPARANDLDPLLDTIRDFVWTDTQTATPSITLFRRKVA